MFKQFPHEKIKQLNDIFKILTNIIQYFTNTENHHLYWLNIS